MKWFENYCTLSALYSFYKNYHDMHANGDITLKYETNTENLTPKEIKEYLSGNLCRCTGYVGQLRAIKKYLAWKKETEA